jgi:hypothetical protein
MTAPIPPRLDLGSTFTIEFTALDATTGAVVNGVTVSDATLTVENVGGGALSGLEVGPFMLVPGPET